MESGKMAIKAVGRSIDGDPIKDAEILQRTGNLLRGCGLIPGGVFRFQTFEEADLWMMQKMSELHARRNSKIS